MWQRMQHAAWWVFFVVLALVGALGLYFLPSIESMENMARAGLAESARGRAQLAAPGVFWVLILAPLAAAITYRCGTQLPGVAARRGALTVGLILAVGSFGGAVLFVIGERFYWLPIWLLLHLFGHRLAPASALGCPFC